MQSQMQSQMQGQVPRPSPTKCNPTLKMKALQCQGKDSMKMVEVPVPMITDPTDVIVKVTALTISASDLLRSRGIIPGIKKGDIIGHECVGIVTEVGPEVKKVKKGDRVVISSVIACGKCDSCKRGEMSSCDTTNISDPQEPMSNLNTGALLGSSRTLEGLSGCQAELVRVPFADVNLLPIPENITDKQAILVSDVATTALNAVTIADVKAGDRVVIIGCGPVGLLTQMWAKSRGASMVVAIDMDPQRLQVAKEKIGSIIINSKEQDPLEAVQTLIPGGPDKVIDCVGLRMPENFLQKLTMKLKVGDDTPKILNLAIKMVRKNGRIVLLGDSVGCTNNVNIGGLMEKHLTITAGQVCLQTLQKEVMAAIASGKIDPTMVVTNVLPLSKLEEAYKMIDKEGALKVLIVPDDLCKGTMSMESQ